MKRKAMIGMIGLALFMGAGTGMALTPPPAPNVKAVAPPAGQRPDGPPPALGARPPVPHPPVAPPPEGTEAAPSVGRIPSAEGARMAVATARQAVSSLRLGPAWRRRVPTGGFECKAALIYEGRCVAVLTFDSGTGTPLPMGFRPTRPEGGVGMDAARERLVSVAKGMEALDGAEYLEKERGWMVPLAFHGEIVAHLKLTEDGRHILPDYPAQQEMRAFGK